MQGFLRKALLFCLLRRVSPAGGTGAPLRAAAVSFVTKQKKPKVGLETKVSKDFLSASPLAWNHLIPAQR